MTQEQARFLIALNDAFPIGDTLDPEAIAVRADLPSFNGMRMLEEAIERNCLEDHNDAFGPVRWQVLEEARRVIEEVEQPMADPDLSKLAKSYLLLADRLADDHGMFSTLTVAKQLKLTERESSGVLSVLAGTRPKCVELFFAKDMQMILPDGRERARRIREEGSAFIKGIAVITDHGLISGLILLVVIFGAYWLWRVNLADPSTSRPFVTTSETKDK